MRKIIIVTLMFLISIMGGYILLNEENENKTSDFRIKTENFDMQVMFEDQTLLDHTKVEIIEDYQSIVMNLIPQGQYPVRNRDKRKIVIDGKAIMVTSGINFTGNYVWWPDDFEDEYGLVGESEMGQEYIMISTKLSDAYKISLDLKKERQEAFAKFKKYINTMNNLSEADLPSLKDLLYWNYAKEKYPELDGNEAIEEFRKSYLSYKFKQSSLLNFEIGSGDYSDNLFASMLYSNSEKKYYGEMPIIYDDGKWKIFTPAFPN